MTPKAKEPTVRSLKAKVKILLAGVVINWLTAVLIFTILAVVGLPKLVENQFTVASDTSVVRQQIVAAYVAPNSPATKSGIQTGDRLVEVAGQPLTSPQQVSEQTKRYAGQDVSIVYEHEGQMHKTVTRLNAKNDNNQGYLGVSPLEQTIRRSTWSAPVVGVGLTTQLTGLTLQGLGSALGNLGAGLVQSISPNGEVRQNGHGNLKEAGESVSGPVGIFVLLKRVSADSFTLALYLIAVISLTLAVMNALPIPALDGGRLFITLLFRALKKPLTKEIEERIHGYGFAALMILVAVITIVDVRRFF